MKCKNKELDNADTCHQIHHKQSSSGLLVRFSAPSKRVFAPLRVIIFVPVKLRGLQFVQQKLEFNEEFL